MSNTRSGTTKNIGRKDKFDRFYTSESEARRLLGIAAQQFSEVLSDSVFVEPSAGKGVFVLACEELELPVVAYDIAPDKNPVCQTVIAPQDFLKLTKRQFHDDLRKIGCEDFNVIFVGNPPFGVQGDLSIRFIEHCYELGAQKVWFILPPTFQKESYQNKIHHAIIEDVHELENTTYSVPGTDDITVPSVFICYDIVEEKHEKIPNSYYINLLPFEFLPKNRNGEADFTIRRVGGKAGTASLNTDVSPQSNYFCKMRKSSSNDELQNTIDRINAIEFVERDWTIGPRSISRGELAKTFVGSSDESLLL